VLRRLRDALFSGIFVDNIERPARSSALTPAALTGMPATTGTKAAAAAAQMAASSGALGAFGLGFAGRELRDRDRGQSRDQTRLPPAAAYAARAMWFRELLASEGGQGA
jgi:hypothetical protein